MLSAKKPSMRTIVRPEHSDHTPAFFNNNPIRDGPVLDCLKSEFPLWQPKNPVMLDLPPGAGKTTFVYDVLMPNALKHGKNLLLVSNRVALSSQQKFAIMQRTNDPRKKLLTDEGVRQTEDFGPIRIITYHMVRPDGSYINSRNMQHVSRVATRELGFEKFDYHSLRVTHATMLAERGASPKYVQHRLGHKNVQVTMNIYQKLTDTLAEEGARLLDTL